MVRIIAKLDIKPPDVVKPVYYEGLRVIGSPFDLVSKYYKDGADEIIYIDIVASLYQRGVVFDVIKQACEGLFVPLAVGGGVKCISDFSQLLHLGADKVVINTHALNLDPSIIDKAASIFGSQSVVVAVEAQRHYDGWNCMSDGGKILSNRNVNLWIKEVESRGAGEIFVSSVDRDGSRNGFDIELAEMAVSSVKIPVVIGGGAGKLTDIEELIKKANPSGVSVATALHYGDLTISDIKKYLLSKNIEVAL